MPCQRKEMRYRRSFGQPHRCSSVPARYEDAPCLTPRGWTKSLAAPFPPIYEMTSRLMDAAAQAMSVIRVCRNFQQGKDQTRTKCCDTFFVVVLLGEVAS